VKRHINFMIYLYIKKPARFERALSKLYCLYLVEHGLLVNLHQFHDVEHLVGESCQFENIQKYTKMSFYI